MELLSSIGSFFITSLTNFLFVKELEMNTEYWAIKWRVVKSRRWGEVFGIFTTLVHFRSSHNFFVCVRICKKETPFFFPVLPTPSCTWVFSLSPPPTSLPLLLQRVEMKVLMISQFSSTKKNSGLSNRLILPTIKGIKTKNNHPALFCFHCPNIIPRIFQEFFFDLKNKKQNLLWWDI